jgi:hypothetical protein
MAYLPGRRTVSISERLEKYQRSIASFDKSAVDLRRVL